MLSTQVFTRKKYKEIYYRNSYGVSIRHVYMDLNNRILQDELLEFDREGRLISCTVFGPNSVTVVGLRKYTYDKDGEGNGFSDFRLINDSLSLICRVESYWTEKDKIARFDWYNSDNQLVYYDIHKFAENIGEMVWEASFDPNDEMNFLKNTYLGKYDDNIKDVLKSQLLM
ncbi:MULTISPECIES: hypothetical protein [unclassified Moraxella]|uniref:hypothetical protein n=1 Tax=unclassified Moraxella TaxID=2685852 RepID=UPI003AF8ABA4